MVIHTYNSLFIMGWKNKMFSFLKYKIVYY